MSRLSIHVAAGVLCVGSLLNLAAPQARACSPLPLISLEPVAYANTGLGPIVLIARSRCGSGTTCPELSSLRIERLGAAGALPGTVEVKAIAYSSDQLVFFRPAAPLDPASTYVAWLDTRTVNIPLVQPGAAAPLERALAKMSSWLEPVGVGYSCESPAQIGGCGQSSGVSWNERSVVHSTLNVRVPANEGWLFRSYQGAAPRGGFSWRTLEETSIDLMPGVEGCVVVEGWDVVHDSHETRNVCATGPILSDAERNKTNPVPNLGACSRPPVRSDTGQEASELLEAYCRDRRAHCQVPMATPNGCGTLDARCAANADAGVRADAGASVARAASADAGGERMASEAAPDDPEQADGDGCTLGRRGGHAWALALLLAMLRTRRRGIREPRQ